jgi:phage-related tail fiber protein
MAFRTIHTNYGMQRIADAQSSGTPIALVQMAVGDGNGNPVEPDPDQTTLARQRYRAGVNRVFTDPADPTRFTAELIIPVDVGGFTIREVGLYDDQGGLFAVANVPDSYKPTTVEGAFSDTVVRMMFVVTNADVVTVVVDPNVAVATHSWVVNNVSAATVIPGGLTGQLLAKNSNADGDTEWIDPAAGFTVIVYSIEETQTLAAAQTIIDLAALSAEGVAVYIEGNRLRADEFSQTGPTQITLSTSYPAGTKATVVQNEEVGKTDVLLRAQNLADVPDKAAARSNLGIPNYVTTASIQWSQLQGVPAYASRWSTWAEVGGKPSTFPPSAHNQDWSTIDNKPAFATRWPTWTEVTGKPSTFTPSAHLHAISDVSNLQASLDAKAPIANPVFTGVARAPVFRPTSSRKVKRNIQPMPYGLAEVLQLRPVLWNPLDSDEVRGGLVAEETAPVIPAAVDSESEIPGIDYAPIVAALVASVHELEARIRELESK